MENYIKDILEKLLSMVFQNVQIEVKCDKEKGYYAFAGKIPFTWAEQLAKIFLTKNGGNKNG